MRDTIHIHGLKLDVSIGFKPHEQKLVQHLTADISIETDFKKGPERDQQVSMLDYFELDKQLRARAAAKRFDLIEALALELARTVLEMPPAERVRVKITKRPPDMPTIEGVSAELVRERGDF